MIVCIIAGEVNDCISGRHVLPQEGDMDYTVVNIDLDDVPEPMSMGEEPEPEVDLNQVEPELPTIQEVPTEENPSPAQEPNATPLPPIPIEDEIEIPDVCVDDTEETVPEMSFEDIQLKMAIERHMKASGQPIIGDIDLDTYELTDEPYQESWETVIDQFLPTKVDKNFFCKKRQWLELVVDLVKKYNSKLRCKVCFKYSGYFSINPRNPSKLSLEEGGMKGSKLENTQAIHRHESLVSHKETIKALKRKKTDELNNVKYTEDRHHQVTIRNFRNVYFGILTTMSFSSHTVLTELEELNGAPFLGSQCRSRWTAAKIAKSISKSMHAEVIESLKKDQNPLSLIMDSSTGELFIYNFQTQIRPSKLIYAL